jgi:hypothetical protein
MLAYQLLKSLRKTGSRATLLLPVQNLVPPAMPTKFTVIYTRKLACLPVKNDELAKKKNQMFYS